MEILQIKQSQINDELRKLKEVQQIKKERLRLIKEQSINNVEKELKNLEMADPSKKGKNIPKLNWKQATFKIMKNKNEIKDSGRAASTRSY